MLKIPKRPVTKFTLTEGKQRFIRIYKLLLLAGFICLAKYAWIQLVNGDEMKNHALDNSTTKVTIQHPRGKILDRSGNELAVSIMTGSLYCDPLLMFDSKDDEGEENRSCDVRKFTARVLASRLGIKEEVLLKKMSNDGSRFEWLKRKLDPSEEREIAQLIKEYKIPGLNFIKESKRYYPKQNTAAQVLGFVGTDDEGQSGLEYMLDGVLKGRKSQQLRTYDAHDKRIYDENVKDSVEAKLPSVYLTLDSHMQYVLEQAIDDAVIGYKAAGAAAIIMDPYTGEILSMVSRPTFDPNNFLDYDKKTWINKGVSMSYEPGSVFKPIVGCIGMNNGVVGPDTQFYDGGRIRVADRVFQNWDGQGGGYITFTDVIKNSVNTGMIELGKRIGKKNMVNGAKDFGFGALTEIDMPGEASGVLYDKDMYDPDLATFSIGQGIGVTPLQMVRAICAIANGGELVKPYIIKKIVDHDGVTIHTGKKEVLRNVITEDVSLKMRQMMEKVVSEGGGKRAAIKGYRIAGKTGTAEKNADQGGYAKGQYIASFVGFVPADKPKYAMLVLVDTPKGHNFYGSQVAAPIFRDVLQQILVLKGIQPEIYDKNSGLDNIYVGQAAGSTEHTVTFVKLPNGNLKLPDLKGLNVQPTIEAVTSAGLKLRPHGSGRVVRQSPAPGVELKPGSVIEVWFE